MPAQRYDVPSRKVGKIFVGILSVELYGVRARKWNAERVIEFSIRTTLSNIDLVDFEKEIAPFDLLYNMNRESP